MKAARLLLTAAFAVALAGAVLAADAGSAVRVHLPRTVCVDAERLHLGMITVVRTSDGARLGEVTAIAMGRAPWSREKLVIDRSTILGRLASHGVKSHAVRFTGAEKVVVTRDERVIEPARIAEVAQAFLQKTRPAPRGCQWQVLTAAVDMSAPAGSEVILKPRMSPQAMQDGALVEVAALAGGKEVAAVPVRFRMMYERRQLVATQDIPPGGAITPQNTELRTDTGPRPEPEDWAASYGHLATRLIPAGTVVRPGLVRAAEAKLLVRRNQNVLMKITGNLFEITALGLALEDGRQGDLIKVRNVDSKRVLAARVTRDGTVEPVFDTR